MLSFYLVVCDKVINVVYAHNSINPIRGSNYYGREHSLSSTTLQDWGMKDNIELLCVYTHDTMHALRS